MNNQLKYCISIEPDFFQGWKEKREGYALKHDSRDFFKKKLLFDASKIV